MSEFEFAIVLAIIAVCGFASGPSRRRGGYDCRIKAGIGNQREFNERR
jgi:hypothetical protein